MNKYSSKAVKTAATVGMSLAMVLSNAAPVFAAAANVTSCAVAVNGLEDFLKNGISIDEFTSANSETTVNMKDVTLNGIDSGTLETANLFILLSAPQLKQKMIYILILQKQLQNVHLVNH